MDPEQNPLNMGQQIAQGIPGVNILTMLRNMGEQAPNVLNQAMELLGLRKPQAMPVQRDAMGRPIAVPGQQQGGGY